MSKKAELADLRVYLEHAGDLYRSMSVSVRRTKRTRMGEYEVYVENFHDILRGRDSMHASGRVISRTTLLDRESYEWTVRVAGIDRLRRISGIAFGRAWREHSDEPNFRRSGISGKQGSTRLTTTMPVPQFQHGYEIFAIPDSTSDTVSRLRSTPPYAKSVVHEVLVADWISPALALVVWVATDPTVYSTTESHRTDTASRRFTVSPAAYRGTWVQSEINSPHDDVMVHGFRHGVWPAERVVDPAEYCFARDGGGLVDRVVITSTITDAAAEQLLAGAER